MSKKEIVRCIHRHTISEHFACFAQAAVEDNRKVTTIPWYQEPGMSICYLDIETDGFYADFNTMLTWSIKVKGKERIRCDVITKRELFEGTTDRRIVESAISELRKHRIVATYYGTGFDIPFLRAKALHYGLDFPSYLELFHFDIYYAAKAKLKISRKSLDAVSDYLNIPGKTHVDRNIWRVAKYGDKFALGSVLEHNMEDVRILEEVHDTLTPFSKWTRKSI